MTAAQILQLITALTLLVQEALARGTFDPSQPIELTTLGDAHRQAVEALQQELDGGVSS